MGLTVFAGRAIADRFEVEARVAGGGMGQVYRAKDRQTGGQVAVKVLFDEGAQSRLRFVREARVLEELSHPGIVAHVAHGSLDDGRLWLAMEWLEGEDLAHRLARGPLPIDEAVALAVGVAGALGAAHGAGLVHRDVKPSNLWLVDGAASRPKLLDFGIVGGFAMTALATRTGATMGTPAYLAPEQLRNARDVDARADVYSLGCVLFECLTGRQPFEGEHLMALLAKVVIEEAPRATDLRPDLPRALDELVSRMLAKDPAERPLSGDALARELAHVPLLAGETERAPPAGLGTSEQRLVTVVLVREGGAPDPTVTTLDPELLGFGGIASAHVLEAIEASVGRGAAGTEAAVHGLLASSAIVTFAGTGTATDRASMAAACALAVRDALPNASISVATGRATISDRAPIGEAIDRAARLLAAVPAGQAYTDALTAELVVSHFFCEAEGDGFVLRGLADRESPRTVLGRSTPFVGRDAELALLEGLFAECAAERFARVAIVTAPAGLGKSRLRDEVLTRLLERSPSPHVWIARADPLRHQAPLDLLAQLVRAAAGLHARDSRDTQRAGLAASLGSDGDTASATITRSAEILGEVIGVPFELEPSSRLRAARTDPVDMAHQIHRACAELFTRAAAERAAVIILDDLHWADAPSVIAIERVLPDVAMSPVLVLAFARPEVRDRFAGLFAKRDPVEVRLAPLRPGPCARLVAALLPKASPTTHARLVEQSEGNALLLEELARASVAGRSGSGSPTVRAMLASRLEALEPDARLVLRAASVIGATFWSGAVRALVASRAPRLDVSALLARLVEREVVLRHPDARFEGETEYSFRHALVHEAAAAMLADADRVAGHRAAAMWLELVGSRDAGAIAEHYEAGGERTAAGPWWLRAARAAFGANALDDASALAQRAINCGVAGETLGAALALRAEVARWLGGNENGQRFALEALPLLARASPAWFGAVIEAGIASMRLGDYDSIARLAAEVLSIPPDPDDDTPRIGAAAVIAQSLLPSGRRAEVEALLDACGDVTAIRDPQLRARVLNAQAGHALSRGNVGLNLERANAAVAVLRESRHERALMVQLVNLGYALTEIGAFLEAEQVLREAKEGSKRLGLSQVDSWARCHLGRTMAALGQHDEARKTLLATLLSADAQDNHRLGAHIRMALASLDAAAGDMSIARAHAAAAIERFTGAPTELLQARALLASLGLGAGDVQATLSEARAAAALVDATGSSEAEAIVRLVYAEAAHAAGELAEARVAIRTAAERLRTRASRVPAKYRADFLDAIRVHRRILALDAEWNGPSD